VQTALRPLVDIAEVARLLGVSKITVRRKVNSRELPCIRLTEGGPMRFDLRDIEEYISRHKS
jgi:excisionase family DNA binding protein